MASKDWRVNYKILEEIEELDNYLNIEYEDKRMNEESRALNKIKDKPAYFYKYSKKN